RKHPDLLRETEDELRDGLPMTSRQAHHLGSGEDVDVGGEKREALVDDVALGAECPHVAVPLVHGKATVLHEARLDLGALREQVQLAQAHVADAEHPRLAVAMEALHRPPNAPVGFAETSANRRSMKDVRVEVVGSKMLERRRERLAHL